MVLRPDSRLEAQEAKGETTTKFHARLTFHEFILVEINK